MLELTVEKISKLHIIYKKRTFIATKANFTRTNLNDILLYKNEDHKIILLWQPSWMPYCIKALLQITKSHFEPLYAWNNLNLMQ